MKVGGGYFDIHNHILPGVDDGSGSVEQSMAMIGMAHEAGTGKLVLTPHFMPGENLYRPDELPQKFAMLKERVREAFPDMELYLGNEILYRDGVVELLKNGEIQTMNGTKFVLVEFNIQISYKELARAVRDLSDARYRIIIAHMERYRCLTGRPERIYELEEQGVYLQMNAESIPGKTFDGLGRWCRSLLKEERITFLGSDAHNMGSRNPSMAKAVEWMEKHLDAGYVEHLLYDYPARMLCNEYPK